MRVNTEAAVSLIAIFPASRLPNYPPGETPPGGAGPSVALVHWRLACRVFRAPNKRHDGRVGMKFGYACLASATALMILASAGVSPAAAQKRFQAGSLTCRLGPSVGLIVGSRQRMRCRFVSAADQRIESYSGTVTRFGLDLGITVGGVMRWSVLTRTRRIGRGTLAGHYVGASADASVGVGIGAKALIGGSRRTTMLQPLSVSGRVGVNLAAGVTGLTLRLGERS